MLYRKRLLALRARLRRIMPSITDKASKQDRSRIIKMLYAMTHHNGDDFDEVLSLNLLRSEKNALDKIEAAIARIKAGTYGRCEACGGMIPVSHLMAIPYLDHCMDCTREQEFDLRAASRHRVIRR